METEETNSFDEEMEEIIMWSITGLVVGVLVVVTILLVRCIWKSTPARETVNQVGRKCETDWKRRVADYYHKYWKVSDPDAPEWDRNRPRTGTLYTEGTIRNSGEAREVANVDEIYSIDTVVN